MSKSSSSKLHRVRVKLERKLARGWARAVFAAPQQPEQTREPEVVEGPGALDPDEAGAAERFAAAFAELWAAAEAAAQAGLVKQAYVLDDRHRIEVDARHGHLKQRELDEGTVAKIMGGKQRPLRPDRSAALLREIGIANADGTISARNAKKYKQVNHLVELCRPLWAGRTAADGPLRILDLACGNSYLSFVLLEALRLEGLEARLLGVDLRADVIASSEARAATLGFDEHAKFVVRTLEQLELDEVAAALGGPPQVAISLHACDTATDAALSFAIAAGVESIFAVPCCQAELARQFERAGVNSASARLFPAALSHGLLRRSLGELLTDSLRVELLAACGYEVAVVEFVASSHTPKNLLLRGRRVRALSPAQWELDDVRQRCTELGVDPALLRSLSRLV